MRLCDTSQEISAVWVNRHTVCSYNTMPTGGAKSVPAVLAGDGSTKSRAGTTQPLRRFHPAKKREIRLLIAPNGAL